MVKNEIYVLTPPIVIRQNIRSHLNHIMSDHSCLLYFPLKMTEACSNKLGNHPEPPRIQNNIEITRLIQNVQQK